MNEKAIRIQFTCYHVLVAEVIVENMREADRVNAAYLQSRYARNLPMGGSLFQTANRKRYWDVPVGSNVR